ncbi:MAG: alkaline phosphatase family protein [Cytophagales bacterium]|nr:alkaline phosphatase family protein [Cytophagales bacterium]
MRYFYILLFSLCFLFACKRNKHKEIITVPHATLDEHKTISRIAFGSCNRQDKPQILWEDIHKQQAELWIWAGDNIYANTEESEVFIKKYNQQLSNEHYAEFVKETPVIGVWDDHDFGVNDGGFEFGAKDISQQYFLDFLQTPKDAPIRKQHGIYQSYTIGEKGKQVKIILLDSRYYRTAITEKEGRVQSIPPNGSILGHDQWIWLTQELKNSTAQAHIIVNGTQVLPQEHKYERWDAFPKERQHLLDLLVKYDVQKPLLLSGDRHFAEFSVAHYKGKKIVEFTSSGLTHSYHQLKEETNKHRVGKMATDLNYGLIHIDWTTENIRYYLEIRGRKGKVYEKLAF